MAIQAKKRAFTLLEVLVASTFLMLGLVSSIQIFASGLRFSRSLKIKTAAMGIAQEKVEKIIALGYENIPAGASPKEKFSLDSSSFLSLFYTQSAISFLDSNLSDSTSDTGLKKIQVEVFWEHEGKENSEKITTMLAKR